MEKTISIQIECASEKEEQEVKQALQDLATKFKGKGFIKLADKYKSDIIIRGTVNKMLGVK